MLENLFLHLNGFGRLYRIQVGQNAHNLGHPMHLADVQELKYLHLKTETGVDHQEDQICTFSYIDHAVDIIVALDQRNSSLLGGDDRNRTVNVGHIGSGKVLNQIIDQR